MPAGTGWTRQQLLVAFKLYCQLPFGKLHSKNPDIVKYADFIGRTPSALAMKLTNIASLDPEITSTGRKGLTGASTADKEMWEEMRSDWERFAIETQKGENSFGSISESQTEFIDDSTSDRGIDYTGKNKAIQSTARIGQNFFRRSVLSAYNYRCCITGLDNPRLLVASHIVPWRVDEGNRLNPRNGLCLSVLHDRAFDAGIITLEENLTVKVSRLNASREDKFFKKAILDYDGKQISAPEKFRPNKEFLAYHRENIFESLG